MSDLGPEPEPAPLAALEPAIEILITRHSFSCNQGVMTKAFDPALTRNGIIMAMERAKYEPMGIKLYDSNIVLVSCLLRTWQTALLLYNPDVEGNESSRRKNFTLYVYPFLKEHRKHGMKRGNYPTELKLTLANFLKFLEFIRANYSDYYINSLPLQININIWNEGGDAKIFSLTRNGINGDPFVVKINEIKCQGCWISRDNNMIDPFLRQGSIFTEDGDLNVFVSHICELSRSESEKLGHTGKIHVVAHSSLMRTYLGEMSIADQTLSIYDEGGTIRSWTEDDLDGIDDMVINNISETNMFSFEMGCSGDRTTLNNIFLGLSIPVPPPERNRELCDMGQFVDPRLSPVPKPEHDIYSLGNEVTITNPGTTADGKNGTIIGTYINKILEEDLFLGAHLLGLGATDFERLKSRNIDVIRVRYQNSSGESVDDNFSKDNIKARPSNSVTLTLAGGGRLKKSKRKNKKTTKRKKNKNKSKRRKKTRARKSKK